MGTHGHLDANSALVALARHQQLEWFGLDWLLSVHQFLPAENQEISCGTCELRPDGLTLILWKEGKWSHWTSSSFVCSAQSFTPNIYTPTPIPLLYNPFTIVLHKSLCAYLFRAAHTPACWLRTKRSKDFHQCYAAANRETRFIGRIPRVCEFRIKRNETDCSVKKRSWKKKVSWKILCCVFRYRI